MSCGTTRRIGTLVRNVCLRPVRWLSTGLAAVSLLMLPRSGGQAAGSAIYPGLGRVTVNTSRPNGDFPTFQFQGEGPMPLLTVKLGTQTPDLYRIYPEGSPPGRPSPVVGYTVVQGPRPELTAFVPIAMYVGGSDCQYLATVVGPRDGRLQTWLPGPAQTFSEGGLYLGGLGKGRGYGLAVWNFLWEDDEAHPAPHRYEVQMYRMDAGTGRLVKSTYLRTKLKYRDDIKALRELGLAYPNLLRSLPGFGC